MATVTLGLVFVSGTKLHSRTPSETIESASSATVSLDKFVLPSSNTLSTDEALAVVKAASIVVPPTFGPAIGPPSSGRILGEFERHDAILLGVNELLQYHPQTLCDIVAALDDRIEIIALISDPMQQRKTLDLLVDRGVSTKSVHFFFWPAISMWVQDFGPIILAGDDVRVIDTTYQFLDRELENNIPLGFAAKYGMKFSHTQLSMEGGNCLSNGKGLCISSTTLIEQNKVRNYDLQAIGQLLKRDFRFEQWSYLPPLSGEPTGHVDMYVTLTSPTTALVGAYNPADDKENAAVLDTAAETLSQVMIGDEKMKVERIPMPSRSDGKWRTYTNVIYANGVVLVPQYPDYCPELDKRALEVYCKLLPDWKVVGVNASELISKRGSLHCLSLRLPVVPGLHASK